MFDFLKNILRKTTSGQIFRSAIIATILLYVIIMSSLIPPLTAYAESIGDEILTYSEGIDNLSKTNTLTSYYNKRIVDTGESLFNNDIIEDYKEIGSSLSLEKSIQESKVNIEREIVKEITKFRTENEKHFLLDDGSFAIASFTTPVHYLTSAGQFEDIDNTIEEINGKYQNKSNKLIIEFPKSYANNALTKVSYENYSISFKMNSSSSFLHSSTPLLNNITAKQKISENSKYDVNIKTNSSITYNFENDILLQQCIQNLEFKENIILGKRQDKSSFTFNIYTQGLSLFLDDYGDIIAKNSNNDKIFIIPKGFMYDSRDNISDNVFYDLTKTNFGYLLTISTDKEWLDSIERTYPVVIDPTIIIFNENENNIDIASRSPQTNHLIPISNTTGNSSSSSKAFIKIPIPNVPDGSIVSYSELNLAIKNTSTDKLVQLFACNTNFEDGSPISYNPQSNPYDLNPQPSPDECIKVSSTYSSPTYTKFKTTNIIKNIIEFGLPYYGFVIDLSTLTTGTAYIADPYYSGGSYCPFLVIHYRNAIGLENYWDYDTYGVGSATAYINRYNDRKTIVHNIIGSTDELPVNVQLINLDNFGDNNYFTQDCFTKERNYPYYGNYGNGWKLNLIEVLLPCGSVTYNSDGILTTADFEYFDADGTLHYFSFDSQSGYAYDEDGLGLLVNFSNARESIGYFILMDNNGNKKYFDVLGYLYRIENANSESVNITFSTLDNKKRINQVYNSRGYTVNFSYSSASENGFLTSISHKGIDKDSYESTTITYQNNSLTRITSHDGYYIDYTDDGFGVSEIIDADGIGVKLKKLVFTTIATELNLSSTINYTNLILTGRRIFQKSLNSSWIAIQDNLYFNDLTMTLFAKSGSDFFHLNTMAQEVSTPYSEFEWAVVVLISSTLPVFLETLIPSLKSEYKTKVANNSIYLGDANLKTQTVYDTNGRIITQYFSENNVITTFQNSYNSENAPNKVSQVATFESNNINEISNGDFASPLTNWSTNGVSEGIVTTTSFSGNNSLKLNAVSSDIRYFKYNNIVLQKGSYTFSGYARIYGAVSNIGNQELYGTYLKVEYGNNTKRSERLVTDCFTTNSGFRLLLVSFEITSANTNVVLKWCADFFTGIALLDCVQLVKTNFDTNISYNFIENAGFEKGINNWVLSSTSAIIVESNSFVGSGIAVSGSYSSTRYFYQNIKLENTKKMDYAISFWVNTKGIVSLPIESGVEKSCVRLKYGVIDSNGGIVGEYKYKDILAISTQWYQMSALIHVPAYSYGIQIRLELVNSNSTIHFDNFSVTKAQLANFEYDANGVNNYYSDENTEISASDNGQTTSISSSKSNGFNLFLDEIGNVTSALDISRGVKVSYTYDDYGNLISQTESNFHGNLKITESSSYVHDKDALHSSLTQIDSLGFKTVSTFSGFTDSLRQITFNDGSYQEIINHDTIIRKNLAALTDFSMTGKNGTLVALFNTTKSNFILTKSNTAYTYSCTRSISGVYKTTNRSIVIYGVNPDLSIGGILAQIDPSSESNIIFTFNSLHYIGLKIVYGSGAGLATLFNSGYLGSVTTTFSNVQLEEGGTKTTFSPFVQTTLRDVSKISVINKSSTGVELSKVSYEYLTIDSFLTSTEYGYRHVGALYKVTFDNGTYYSYQYNEWGEIEAIKINGITHLSYVYRNDGALTQKNYNNGYSENYFYDASGKNIRTTATQNSTLIKDVSFIYSVSGTILHVTDNLSSRFETVGEENGLFVLSGNGINDICSTYFENILSGENQVLEDKVIEIDIENGTHIVKSTKYKYGKNTLNGLNWDYIKKVADYCNNSEILEFLPDEIVDGIKYSEIIKTEVKAFYKIGEGMKSMIDSSQFETNQCITFTYSIRLFEFYGTNVSVGNFRYTYTDGSEDTYQYIPNDTNWHNYTLISAPGKTVRKLTLGWYNSYPVLISNMRITQSYWNPYYLVNTHNTNGTPQIVDNEIASDGRIIENIVKTVTNWHTDIATSSSYSLVPSAILNSLGQISLEYDIRRETIANGTLVANLRIHYKDGTYTNYSGIPNDTEWHHYSIVSNPAKIVEKIILAWYNAKVVLIGNVELTSIYQKNTDQISAIELQSLEEIQYDYDDLGRLIESQLKISTDDINSLIKEKYSYHSGKNGATSTLINSKTTTYNGQEITLRYYYGMDNDDFSSYSLTQINPYSIRKIESVSSSGLVTTLNEYFYNDLGLLIRENNFLLDKTFTYSYDSNYNILSKTIYATASSGISIPSSVGTLYTYSYNSNFNDRLTAFKNQTITYDSFGIPTNYFGTPLSWDGSKLVQYGSNVQYHYNATGFRSRKIDGSITTDYIYKDDRLYKEQTNSSTTYYLYDLNGLIGFTYNKNDYYYIKNILDDVEKIIDINGVIVAEYSYDAWGNVLYASGPLAQINHILYRSYYYDSESNLYYLNSRYYDPNTQRFISPDSIAEKGNLYTYCQNDPINRSDESGNKSWWNKNWKRVLSATIVVASVVTTVLIAKAYCTPASPYISGAVVNAGMEMLQQIVFQEKNLATINYAKVGVMAASGMLSVIPGVGWLGAGLINGGTDAAITAIDGGSPQEIATSGAIGFVTGAVIHKLFSGGMCFIEGTGVLTSKGALGIELVGLDTIVYAYDELTGEIGLKPVVQLFKNSTDVLTKLKISDGQEITTTPTHPFYTVNLGWLEAKFLKAGDILVTVNGQLLVLELIEHIILESPVNVYNFEVAEFHTYFIAANVNISLSHFVLVHNTKCQTRKTTETHHIIEQNQMRHSGFTKEQVNQFVIELEPETHRKISNYYSSKKNDEGVVFRVFLRGKTFDEQFYRGVDILFRALMNWL
ncbi:MAG: hypothetical protein LBU04_01010 [Christensenellaceae bacterium]|jgi:RHS repeat-associated protein|nr:hypothetical protein [Christensenellaceae bacterium]